MTPGANPSSPGPGLEALPRASVAPSLPTPPVQPVASTGLIGLVGLGLVGTALSRRMGAAGLQVLGFDRSNEACAAWMQAGLGQQARSLWEVGQRCAAVVLAVFQKTASGLAGLLPQVIDQLTPSGEIRDQDISAGLDLLKGKLFG